MSQKDEAAQPLVAPLVTLDQSLSRAAGLRCSFALPI
ncbi:hypothetical protein BH24ACT9_BH24ACT9_00120 [soil metagenome]|jgi:hypothetical protein